MNDKEFRKSLASGTRGEAKILSALSGKAFWGTLVSSYAVPWDGHRVCRAQWWQKVGKRKENYDFIVHCPSCQECQYKNTCDSEKPYNKEVQERHEAKTNYSAHMRKTEALKGKSTGRTQNIYIEIYQNYTAWLKDKEDIHLGWYHEKFKHNRPKWYHFYQPIVDPEGDGMYEGSPYTASKEDIETFKQLASVGDSLVIENPWGYILSITSEALDKLIDKLEKEQQLDYVRWMRTLYISSVTMTARTACWIRAFCSSGGRFLCWLHL